MMDGINNGWGMGWGGGMIIGLIAVSILIWGIIKLVNRNTNSK
jgi:hypothetical protein